MTFLSAPPSSTPMTSVDGVEAERFGGELLLDAGGDGGVVEGDGDGGGLALGDFQSEAGAGERADGKGNYRGPGRGGIPEELTSGAPASTKTSRLVSGLGSGCHPSETWSELLRGTRR